MTEPKTADQYEGEQDQEWTTWVALVPIDFYGVRAYNAGHPVPASAVGDDPDAGRWVPERLVQRVGAEPAPVEPTPATIDTAAHPGPAASPAEPLPDTTTEV